MGYFLLERHFRVFSRRMVTRHQGDIGSICPLGLHYRRSAFCRISAFSVIYSFTSATRYCSIFVPDIRQDENRIGRYPSPPHFHLTRLLRGQISANRGHPWAHNPTAMDFRCLIKSTFSFHFCDLVLVFWLRSQRSQNDTTTSKGTSGRPLEFVELNTNCR